MKNIKKLLALLLALAMVLSVVACGSSSSTTTTTSSTESTSSEDADDADTADDADEAEEEEADEYTGGDTLVFGEDTIEGKFNPLFYTAATDDDVNSLIFDYLLTSDREGAVILNGMEGETVAYNGTDYTYYSVANCEVVTNDDGTVTYTFTMREDIQYSDGTYATIDDALFALYVVLDPTYDGIYTINSLSIVGLDDYVNGMDTLYNLLLEAGEDNTDFTYWTEETQTAFWSEGINEAGTAWAQTIVDYVTTNYGSSYAEAYLGCTYDEYAASEGLQVCLGMLLWGFAEGFDDDGLFIDALGNSYDVPNGEYPTAEDYWNVIIACYDYDYEEANDVESAEASLWSCMAAEYAAGVSTGNSATSVSGIVKNNDYSMSITLESADATAIYNLAGIPLLSVAYYGTCEFDYDNDVFGFTKGDLSAIKNTVSTPMGSGPYKFLDFTNGTVHLQANEYYWKGCPKITYVTFISMSDSDKIPALETGTIDVTVPSYSSDTVAQITEINGGEGVTGSVITTYTVDNKGYGYIGINAQNVSVGGEAGSYESKCLRKALATIFAVYRDEAIDTYYGELATVINYPISNTSWAAPRTTDEGYAVAFSVDVNGDPIYTEDMTTEERYAAALEAALGFLEAAGYTIEDGVCVAAPDGAKLEYSAYIPGGGTGSHPNYLILTSARDALATIGITLQVIDVTDGTVTIGNMLSAGTMEIWTMAWSASVDPDMYQIYYSDVANGGTNAGGSAHYYGIQDETLDELILLARTSFDTTYRKQLYKEALDIIIDWADEVPVYQRLNAVSISTERVNIDTVTPDITTYWGWTNDIELLEMN